MLAQEHDPVSKGRDEIQRELDFPVELQFVIQDPAQYASDDKTGWPARVQNVQIMRAVVRIERGHERVRDCLQRPIRVSKDKHAPIKTLVGGSAFGGEGHDGRKHMQRERDNDEFAIADLVADHAANDDAEAEARKSRAANRAELRAGETEFGSPVVEDAAANRKTDPGGQNGHEPSDQQTPCIGRNGCVVNVCHNLCLVRSLESESGQFNYCPAF